MAQSSAVGSEYDAIVLGAGAAGLFCAALAGERGRRVLLLDHAPRAGRKILISGGGRSNFTNLGTQPEHFLSENPHFAKSALARYTPFDFLALVERYGIAYHEKAPGQLFCNGSAAQIVDMLLDLCARAGVTLRLATEIRAVRSESGSYEVDTAPAGSALAGPAARPSPASASNPSDAPPTGPSPTHAASSSSDAPPAGPSPTPPAGPSAALTTYRAPALVIATGGLSIPKLGATAFGYDLARQFGLRVVEPRPALVPLLFSGDDRLRFEGLSGVATEVIASVSQPHSSTLPTVPTFQDKLLITHRGVSGPAILQISSYWRPGATLTLDLAPGHELTAALLAPGARREPSALASAWQSALPRRLADRLLEIAPPANLRTPALQSAEHALHHWPLTPSGTEGYEKAEVTAGGVATDELSAKTMESRRHPGLFFIGEVVDVTGWLGGYNFQLAWASAAAAAAAL